MENPNRQSPSEQQGLRNTSMQVEREGKSSRRTWRADSLGMQLSGPHMYPILGTCCLWHVDLHEACAIRKSESMVPQGEAK
eukprot:1309282-Amphidinium_carterae.1